MLYGEGNGTPLQYSCLENSMDGGAWWVAVHECSKTMNTLLLLPLSRFSRVRLCATP